MAEKGERTKKQPRIEADTLDLQEKVVHLNQHKHRTFIENKG